MLKIRVNIGANNRRFQIGLRQHNLLTFGRVGILFNTAMERASTFNEKRESKKGNTMAKTGKNIFTKSGNIDRRSKSARIMNGRSKLGLSKR